MRAVYRMGVMEGNIAAGLSAIQDRFFADADLGSYPFQRDGRWRGGDCGQGDGRCAAMDAAIAEASAMIEEQNVTPVQGEPPA